MAAAREAKLQSRGQKANKAARPRPSGERLFAAVVELVSASGSSFKATARRYSICLADAEDAYQRGLEILMTKAPTDERDELRPWLHTVIKHEALALRRQRERVLPGTDLALDTSVAESCAGPEEGATERQRAVRTAEALGQLKSSELRCMLLKALGYSYEEISARTGFSWTKVNRSLTEGRKRFFDRFAEIESGERCERFQPFLSAACDGEASSEEEQVLATHMRGCQSCRAAVRSYRAAPGRLAELLPPAVLLPLLAQRGGWWSRLYESAVAGTGDRAGALGYKLQQASELLSAQKATAVVASTAAIAGGAAVHERAPRDQSSKHRDAVTREISAASTADTAPAAPELESPSPPTPASQGDPGEEEPARAEDSPPAGEFTPETVAATSAVTPVEANQSGGAPAKRSSAPASPTGGASEFGP